MTAMLRYNIRSITLDELGRAVIPNLTLSDMDMLADIAGGTDNDPGSNASCPDSSNTNCTNGSCPNSTNAGACMNSSLCSAPLNGTVCREPNNFGCGG
jgi:hypothetical protein